MAKTEKVIRASLEKQLRDRGADVDHFSDLLDSYLWFWKQEKAMQKDVQKRGVSFEATSAAGKTYDKENPAVKNAILYNKQKLAILKELELTTKNVVIDDDSEL